MIDVPAFLRTPQSWVIGLVAFIAIIIVLKVARLLVRILALLVSLATIGYLILRSRGH